MSSEQDFRDTRKWRWRESNPLRWFRVRAGQRHKTVAELRERLTVADQSRPKTTVVLCRTRVRRVARVSRLHSLNGPAATRQTSTKGCISMVPSSVDAGAPRAVTDKRKGHPAPTVPSVDARRSPSRSRCPRRSSYIPSATRWRIRRAGGGSRGSSRFGGRHGRLPEQHERPPAARYGRSARRWRL